MNLKEQSWIAADGVKIVGNVAGDPTAPAVVLLHGGGQTRHAWSATARRFSESGFYVINYDLRGHGDSGWSPDRVYSFARHASDLRSVLQDLPGPVALVGASMGGMSAMHAVASGLRPQALVLVDIVLAPEREGVEKIRKFMLGNPDGFASLHEAADAIAAYNPNRPRPKNLSGLLKNLRLREDGRYYWHWDPCVIADRADGEIAEMSDMIEGLRAASQIPSLLVRGLKSDVVSDAGIGAFRDVLPQLEVFEVKGAGHMVAGDNNDDFSAAVDQFLARTLRGECKPSKS